MRPDFGEDVKYHQGVKLTCARVAPGLTLHDLTMIFERAVKQAGPSDHLSGNPSKWPDVRGVTAVTEAILIAVYGRDSECHRDATDECSWAECPRGLGYANCPLDLNKIARTSGADK